MNMKSIVQGVILFINGNEKNCIAFKVKVSAWIPLNLGCRGSHVRDAMMRSGSNIVRSYKTNVLKFQLNRLGGVTSMLVDHAYMHHQLHPDLI